MGTLGLILIMYNCKNLPIFPKKAGVFWFSPVADVYGMPPFCMVAQVLVYSTAISMWFGVRLLDSNGFL